MANGHGGARQGSGRKAKAITHEKPVAAAEKKIADRLPHLVDRMLELAEGGIEIKEDHYAPAGTVVVDDIETDDTPNGPRSRRVKKPAFPNKKPDEMVLVKQVVRTTGPDRAAGEYLIDRIMGKPTERIEQETDVTGKIEVTTQAAQAADKRLNEWREKQKKQLENMKSSSPAAPPT